MHLNLQEILDGAVKASRQAGDEIMRYYHGDNLGIITKDDGSPVTLADKAAEAILLPALRQLTPDIPIVSEESFSDGDRPDISGGTFWTVDPIDGTKQFINKTDGFVVALALIVDRYPVLGLVFHPALDLLYTSTDLGTALKTKGNSKSEIMRCRKMPDEGAFVLTNGSYADIGAVDKWLKKTSLPVAKRETSSPTFIYCRVAEGSADVFAGLHAIHKCGGVHWWDIAPGQAIIEAAGGSVKDLNGQRICYDSLDFLAAAHIARGIE